MKNITPRKVVRFLISLPIWFCILPMIVIAWSFELDLQEDLDEPIMFVGMIITAIWIIVWFVKLITFIILGRSVI
jgi:hypothetical protein